MQENNKPKQPNPYAKAQKKEQDDIVLSYMPALRSLAFRLKERLPASIDVNDLISIGTEEMIKQSRRWDKEQNDSFWGFAKKRVHGAMLDYLRSLDVLSRANRALVKAVNSAIDEYYNKHECEPDNQYLAKLLGEDEEKIADARGAGAIISLMPLNEQIEAFDQNDTLETIEKEDMLERIKKALSGFKQRDQLLMQLYYYEELSLKEIGEIMQISESRVSQIHKRLLDKIRASLGE